MFSFQQSQITQKKFDQLANLLLKYPMVYATSKFDVGKVNSLLHLSLKPVSNKNEQVKFQFTYKIKSVVYKTY